MEADISIWRKSGHFYFALTRGPVYWNSWYRLLPGANATGTFAHFRRYLSGALSERLQIW